MTVYDRVEALPGGRAALARARLARTVEVALHEAGVAVPRRWFRRRRVGRLTVTELADLLEGAGWELDVVLVPYGEPRQRAASPEA